MEELKLSKRPQRTHKINEGDIKQLKELLNKVNTVDEFLVAIE